MTAAVKSKLKARNPEEVTPGKIKGLIFGKSGVGKTWLTMSFPAPYYIDTEGGGDLRHYQDRLASVGGVYMGPSDGSLDFGTVIDQMIALTTEKHPYKTLIIDSITKLYQTAIANEQERLGDKDAFGASKKPAIQFMRRLVNWACKLDMNIWLVAHEAIEWGLDAKTGQRTEVGNQPDTWDKLIYELDLTIRAEKRGSSRVAVVRKSRLIGFPDLDTFPLEYAEIATRYGKDFIEADVKPLMLASGEQVAEIKRLLEVVKVDTADVEKILTKAGAERWEELSTEHAEKAITWLKNKITKG
jgi:GTPase SAR1 family protein